MGIETYLGLPREKFQSENLCEKLSQMRQKPPVEVALSKYSQKDKERLCMY